MGDILLTTPLLRTLRKYNEGIKIDFVLREQYQDTLRFNPHVWDLMLYKKPDNKDLFTSLKAKKYDLIVDLQNNMRSKELVKKLNAPVLKFHKRSIDKFLLVNFKVNRLKNAPQIPLRYAASIPGLTLDDEGLELFLPAGEMEFGKFEPGEKYIGLCPGSRHFTKMWPPEYFVELGVLLSSEGYKVLLFGGRSDREICSRISASIPDSADLSNEDDLFATASGMKACSAVICNDSGMMHTACAVRTPVIALFGSTVREFGFAPYNNKNLILENNSLSCRPCSHIGRDKCPLGHFKCMREITPATVLNNVKTMLSEL